MNINQDISTIEKIDKIFDYIPVISTLSNIFQIFQKCILLKIFSEEEIHKNHSFDFVYNKSLIRCIFLLIPVFGNLAVALYDFSPNLKFSFNQLFKTNEKTFEDIRKVTEEAFQLNQEYEKTKKELSAHQATIETIKINLKCVKCAQIVFSPLVTGKCGHIACENCLEESFETALSKDQSALCPSPLCNEDIVPMPIKPQQAIAAHVRKLEFELNPELNKENSNTSNNKLNDEHNKLLKLYKMHKTALHLSLEVYSNPNIQQDHWKNGITITFDNKYPRLDTQFFYDLFHALVSKKDSNLKCTFDKTAMKVCVQPIIQQEQRVPEDKKLKILIKAYGKHEILKDAAA